LEALKTLASDPSVPPVCVQAAGYLDPADRSYLADLQRDAAVSGLADRFTYRGELDRAGKIAFLQSCDVFSTPTISRESKGLPVLEAWANAVPAVLPAHGAFCELVEDTGGGVLYPPNDSAALAQTLKRMVLSPDFAAACGRKAQQAVQERYNATKAAERMLEIYQNSH
jgi:glycosyltransferase involved in cell wall biosynthesis